MAQSIKAGNLSKGLTYFLIRNRKVIIEIISALFILLFLYTSINKTFHIHTTAIVIGLTSSLDNVSYVVAWSIVVSEYLVSILLLIPKTRRYGLLGSLILMLGFTVYIGLMLMTKSSLPCSCGGVISKLSWKQHLIFNIFFTFLAFVGVWLEMKSKKLIARMN